MEVLAHFVHLFTFVYEIHTFHNISELQKLFKKRKFYEEFTLFYDFFPIYEL